MGNIELLADEAVERTYKESGMELYARIYWQFASFYPDSNIFFDSYADWPKMKQGIKDLLKRYPDPWNINHFAYFSCKAADKEMTKQLISEIETPHDHVWPKEHFEACQKFAELE